jgi:hypothetical protein
MPPAHERCVASPRLDGRREADGFPLLQAIADIIDGVVRELPALIVVDANARGCTGTSIAAGLRELGIRIPIVLVHRPGQRLTESDDPSIRAVAAHDAIAAVACLAGVDHATWPGNELAPLAAR